MESIENKSQVSQFFANKNVLITGGAGFIGKLLVEKLLRSTKVKRIYLILRQKAEKGPEERLDEILKNALFDSIKEQDPNFRQKLHPIRGDMACKNLALMSTDRKLLIEKTDIVIHAAASVNFKISLKEAANINIRGTMELLELCEEMQHLSSVMIISTAYSFAWRKVIGEYFMPSPLQPETLLNMIDEFDDDALEKMTPTILGKWPNTYTYTKAVMEEAVRSKRDKLPIGLYRPSIVLPTYQAPLKGWSDNYNGPVGIMIVVGIGLVHVLLVDKTVHQDTIPGDFCVNGCLAATHEIHEKYKKEKIPEDIIYNYAASTKYSITYGQYQELTMKNFVPGERPIWACFLYQIRNPILFWILNIFLHYIPALFLDASRILRRKKPMLLKAYYKIDSFYRVFQYFMDNEWKMEHDNVLKLWDRLNEEDKKEFPFDIRSVDWEEYYKTYTIGTKHYVLGEKIDKESMDVAWKKVEKLRFYHKIIKRILQAFMVFVFIKILSIIFNYC